MSVTLPCNLPPELWPQIASTLPYTDLKAMRCVATCFAKMQWLSDYIAKRAPQPSWTPVPMPFENCGDVFWRFHDVCFVNHQLYRS